MSKIPTPGIQKLFDLSGRAALVTGGSGHLGFAMAEGLAEAGCRVVVGSRTAGTGAKTAASLGGIEKGKHFSVVLDHLDEKSLEGGFSEAVAEAGHIDILVNNGHQPLIADWSTVTGEQFTKQLANATGYFLLARLLRNHAVKRNAPGNIIMLGSMYGQVASYPEVYEEPGTASPAAYHALKGGIIHLTRHLAVYWSKDNVRVNCVSPGPFPAPGASTELVKKLKTKSPMKRMGEPHEIKGAVVFLASDAASYVTGHNLVVDGGWTAW